MFSSITCQIKKLDKELSGCKERLNALKSGPSKKGAGVCFQTVKKIRRSRSVMNRKKYADNDCEPICKKHHKAQKKSTENSKRNTDLTDNKKAQKTRTRSRSVSCGRDCDCVSENNYLHNNLGNHKVSDNVSQKNSWANILKDHNKHSGERPVNVEGDRAHSGSNKNTFAPVSIYLKNRGVQCSENSFIPSRTNSGITGFTPYNPTRTLQFLMSEIRENLKHKREDKVLNIISDMEETVYRLKSNHDYNIPTYPYKSVPEHNYKEQVLNNNLYPSQEVNRVFEEGFARLETTCKSLELTCARLKEENTQLQLELQKKELTISIMDKKEKEQMGKIDLLNKHISLMSQKEEQNVASTADLTKLLHKVQQENKCIEPLKEINCRLDMKLTELSKEKDDWFFDNQMLKLENEKLKVLLQIKDKQLNNYKDIFNGLEDKVKKDVKVIHNRVVSEESELDSSVPLCSSPNTSNSMMAPAYGSWRGISRVSSQAEEPPRSSDYPLNSHHPNPACDIKDLGKSQLPLPLNSNAENIDKHKENAPPSMNPLDGIEAIRGQMKMLFSHNNSKVSSTVFQNPPQQWRQLNTLHSSLTSYNTSA